MKSNKPTKTAKKRAYSQRKNPLVATKDSLITKEICANIRSVYSKQKKSKGWTQKQFGEYIGVPAPYIKGVLQSRYAPSHACIAQISKLFGVSIDWIYGLSDGEVG